MEMLENYVSNMMNLYYDHIKAVKMFQKLYPAHAGALENLKVEIESRIDSLEDNFDVYATATGEAEECKNKAVTVPKTVGFKSYESTAPSGVAEDEEECYD